MKSFSRMLNRNGARHTITAAGRTHGDRIDVRRAAGARAIGIAGTGTDHKLLGFVGSIVAAAEERSIGGRADLVDCDGRTHGRVTRASYRASECIDGAVVVFPLRWRRPRRGPYGHPALHRQVDRAEFRRLSRRFDLDAQERQTNALFWRKEEVGHVRAHIGRGPRARCAKTRHGLKLLVEMDLDPRQVGHRGIGYVVIANAAGTQSPSDQGQSPPHRPK